MDLMDSYQQTEVGAIPTDWKVKPLGSVCHRVTTGALDVNAMNPNGKYRFYTCAENYYFIDTFAFDTEALLVSGNGANVGYVHYYKGKFNAYQRTYVLSQFDVSIKYVQYYLSQRLAERIRTEVKASNTPYITRGTLTDMMLVFPSAKFEQDAIAEALSDADAYIESLEQLLAKKRNIKLGAMQELLSGKRRLPGFDDEWESKRLGDYGAFLKGTGITRDQASSGEIPCVRYGELYTQYDSLIREFSSWISVAVAKTATALLFGDILFAVSGETKEEIGKCAALTSRRHAYAGGDIVIFRSATCDPEFLGYYLNSEPIRTQKASRGQGDAVVHISAKSLADIRVTLPSRPEQKAIATVFSDMDCDLSALEAKLSKARDVKQGMMQQLLTGKSRLI